MLTYSRWVHQACKVVFVTSETRKERGEEIERRGGEERRRGQVLVSEYASAPWPQSTLIGGVDQPCMGGGCMSSEGHRYGDIVRYEYHGD